MANAVILTCFALLLLAQIPIAGFATWLAAKITRIQQSSLLKSLVVGTACSSANLLIAVLATGIILPTVMWPPAQQTTLVITLLLLATSFVLPWFFIQRGFRCTMGRAALATVVFLIIDSMIGVPLAAAVRVWVAEAFVVPTGSMATNIIGAHCDLLCSNCQWRYHVSMVNRLDPQGRLVVRPDSRTAQCPNCNAAQSIDANTPILSGDRFLCDKLVAPRRWEVVVYEPPDVPGEKFVQRLVGLPGEELTIFAGDIFVNQERLTKQPNEQTDLWFFIHDTKYQPRELQADGPQWRPVADAGGWQNENGSWKCANSLESPALLEFTGKVTNDLAYNLQSRFSPPAFPEFVGDVRLDCWLPTLPRNGRWGWRWRFGGEEFVAEFDGDRQCSLNAKLADGTVNSKTQAIEGDSRRTAVTPSVISFVVRDGEASVLIDDRVVALLDILSSQLLNQPTAPSESNCQLTLFAAKCELAIDRMLLRRDVYYTQPLDFRGPSTSNPFRATLAQDEMFVLGDNSALSKDSRYHGPFKSENLVGVGRWIYWPLSRWHTFR